MKSLLMIAAAALALSACGGRPHIEDDTGAALRRLMSAQIESKPRRPLPALGAEDAKGILGNHQARWSPKKVGSSGGASGVSVSGAAAGLLTPLMQSFGDPAAGGDSGDYNPNPIRLQAK
jgi:hypothetical protein